MHVTSSTISVSNLTLSLCSLKRHSVPLQIYEDCNVYTVLFTALNGNIGSQHLQ